jgi:ketosteroid isomerase-like protein
MERDAREFEQFMKDRETAARAYVNGDPKPVCLLSAHTSPATFLGPGGGATVGAAEVVGRYERDAEGFAPGGEAHFEILQQAAGDTVAFWTGFQHAQVRQQGKPDPIVMKLRVTEVFRREGSRWRLIHRHADPLGEPQAPR